MSNYPLVLFDRNSFDATSREKFSRYIYDYYYIHGRTFAWRENITPYGVFVSEIMLQQTQTNRISEKFDSWMSTFPSFQALASAPFDQVLESWMGLGYNRRALWMHNAARHISDVYDGKLPHDPDCLVQLKGIGKATSCSMVTFAYNIPTTFIETNIRAVFLALFFFDAQDPISDSELFPLINATVDQVNPRLWYYALMDFGVYLKKILKNPSRKSSGHKAQSTFSGSKRQLRGKALRILFEKKSINFAYMENLLNDERAKSVLDDLIKDGLISKKDDHFFVGVQ